MTRCMATFPDHIVIVSLQILLDIPCWVEMYVVGMVVKGFDNGGIRIVSARYWHGWKAYGMVAMDSLVKRNGWRER